MNTIDFLDFKTTSQLTVMAVRFEAQDKKAEAHIVEQTRAFRLRHKSQSGAA